MRNCPPISITTDEFGSYPEAIRRLQREGRLAHDVMHRTSEYLNNVIEADHGALKHRIRPARGFQTMKTAYAVIKCLEIIKNPSYARSVRDLKRAGRLWRLAQLRQRKYLNNIIEHDHRWIKRLVRPELGFGSLRTARRTLAGYEAMARVRTRQMHNVGERDIEAQPAFVTDVFRATA